MAISFVNAGTVDNAATAITPGLPASIVADDILLLFLETANEAITIPTPNGGTWTEVPDSPQGQGTPGAAGGVRLTIFWSRYNGTQGAPTTSDSGNHNTGQILAYRGCIATGDPFDVTAGDTQAATTSGSIPGDTTTVDGCMIVAAAATDLDLATNNANASGWTNASLASINERIDRTFAGAQGGGLAVADGIQNTRGAFNATTWTQANSAALCNIVIALKPPTTTPAVVATTVAIPTPTISVPSAGTATPAVIPTVVAVPTPSPLAASLVAPSVVSLLAAIPTPTAGPPGTAPQVRSVGTIASGTTGTITPGLPAGTTTDDILLIYCETAAHTPPTPTGYAAVADSPQQTGGTSGVQTNLFVFWKRAGASETAPDITAGANHLIARMIAVSGCVTTGDPWDVTSGSVDTAATTSVSIPGDTTTVDNCLCLAASSANLPDAVSTTEFGAPTNADLTSVTEQIDNAEAVGNGGALQVVSGVKATAGTVGATTSTAVTDPDSRAYHFMALKPAGGGGATTVTPAVVSTVVAVPTPAPLAASLVAPSVVATVVALPTPSPLAASVVTPSVISTIISVPTPTILAASVVAPAVLPTVVAIPTPQPSVPTTAAPGVILTVVSIPTPAILVAPIVSPAVVATVVALPTPGIIAPVTVTPAVVALTTTIPTPVAGTASPGLVTPATVPLVVSLPNPEPVVTGQNKTVTPAVIALSITIPTPYSIGMASNAVLAREAVVTGISNDAANSAADLAREAVTTGHHFPEDLTFAIVASERVVIAISRPHGWGVFDDPAL